MSAPAFSADGDCRLLLDGRGTGPWNMAVDEVLLESAAQGRQSTLRIYQWLQPTLSLGYFQPAADRETHPASQNCPWVRRASGGGAIVHDREITLCLAIPDKTKGFSRPEEIYSAIRDLVSSALGRILPITDSREECSSGGDSSAFLCFQRHCQWDLIVAGSKICGTAQRRLQGGTLIHGSILLGRSPFGPTLLGIAELCNREVDEQMLMGQLVAEVESKWSWRLIPGELTSLEISRASDLAEARFGSPRWSCRR